MTAEPIYGLRRNVLTFLWSAANLVVLFVGVELGWNDSPWWALFTIYMLTVAMWSAFCAYDTVRRTPR